MDVKVSAGILYMENELLSLEVEDLMEKLQSLSAVVPLCH